MLVCYQMKYVKHSNHDKDQYFHILNIEFVLHSHILYDDNYHRYKSTHQSCGKENTIGHCKCFCSIEDVSLIIEEFKINEWFLHSWREISFINYIHCMKSIY